MEFEMIVLYEYQCLRRAQVWERRSLLAVFWTYWPWRQKRFLHLIRIQMIERSLLIIWYANKQVRQSWRFHEMNGWAWWRRGTRLMWNWVEDPPAFFFNPWTLDQVKGALRLSRVILATPPCLRRKIATKAGYSLRKLKNFAMLITLLELQFRSLNLFDRINYVPLCATGEWRLGLTTEDRLMPHRRAGNSRISITTIISKRPTVFSFFWI